MAPYLFNPFISIFGKVLAGVYARGWGDDVEWMGLGEGRQKAARDNMPLMVVVFKASCGHCIQLKRDVANSSSFASLSRNFAMVNLDSEGGGEVPATKDFYPDGFYVPRVMFYSPNGQLMRDVCCVSSNEYKYNYMSSGAVESGMRKALSMVKSG